jgi:hypothetical protein
MPLRECRLDRRLPFEEPVHGSVEIIGIGALDLKEFSQSGEQRLPPEPPGSGELRARIDHASDKHCHDKVAMSRPLTVKDPLDSERPRSTQHSGNVPMRPRADDLECVLKLGRNRRPTLEHGAQRFHLLSRPVGEIRDCLLLDATVLPE